MIQQCAAPLRARLDPVCINSSHVYIVKKRSHRGIRSKLACLRRALPKRCRTLPGIVSGESETRIPEEKLHGPQEFEIFDEEDIINSMHERKMEEKGNSFQEMTEKKHDEVRKKKNKE